MKTEKQHPTRQQQHNSSKNNGDAISQTTEGVGLYAPSLQLKSDKVSEEEEQEVQMKKTISPFQMKKDGEEEEEVQMKKGKGVSNENESSNSKLPGNVQAKMEGTLGHDFSNVNIHTNSSKAKDVGALAYTQGNDVHFAPGQFKPDTKQGQELIGHEFAHVVQQSQGRVQPTTQAKGMPVNDDKGLEKEADDMGRKVVNNDNSKNYIPSSNNLGINNSNISQFKTLDEIRTEYQVEDDTTEEWSPKMLGFIPIPGAPTRELTTTEGELLDNLSVDKGLIGLSNFRNIKDKAFEVSDREYPNPTTYPAHAGTTDEERHNWANNDGHRDAFRHCYWNVLLTKKFGENWTEQFATAHEALPGNPAEREAMDLYNNEVGRQIARSNKGKSEEDLVNIVKNAVNSGRLLVINQLSNLEWSNNVALWEHGTTSNISIKGNIEVPEGDASAHS